MTQKPPAAAKHPVDILNEDHQKVLKLLKEVEATEDGREKRRLAQDIFVAIEVHAKLEEEIFYPTLLRRTQAKELEKLLHESVEEHHVASVLVAELKPMSTTDPRYDAKFKVLREAVKHHSEEQIEDTFPVVRQALGEDGMTLGDKMMERKLELTPPEYRKAA